MSDKKKKKWTRPQLVIIGRGNPEERVLVACKDKDATGPFTDGSFCQVPGQGTCQGIGQS